MESNFILFSQVHPDSHGKFNLSFHKFFDQRLANKNPLTTIIINLIKNLYKLTFLIAADSHSHLLIVTLRKEFGKEVFCINADGMRVVALGFLITAFWCYILYL